MTELNLITDRTQADVDYALALKKRGWGGMTAAERAEWTAGLKGAYNATDLNRVGEAMRYVASRFNEFGYSVSIFPKLDWTETEIPTFADMESYLSNLSLLRGMLSAMKSTPEVPPDMEALTYTEANNIEKILEDIDTLLTRAAQAWYYSDDVFSGEV